MAVTGARNPGYTADRRAMTNAQKIAGALGAVFLLVGIAGFIPGITTDVGDITFWGTDSGAHLLDVFHVSIFHNIVHLLYGVAGLGAMATGWRASRSYLLGGGAIYLVLWLYGLVIDLNSDANFVPLNNADNWLHLGLGLAMIVLGLAVGRELVDRTGLTRTADPRGGTAGRM